MRHVGESYENLVLVGGFSKAYSSLLAFIACPTELKQLLEGRRPAVPLLGPVAGRLAGDGAGRVRGQRAPRRRAARELYRHTARVLDAVARLGVRTPNHSGLPIIEIPLRDHTRIDAVGRLLFERGVYVTLAAYPLVPKDEVGFRVQLTAANTDAEVDRADRGARRARHPRRAAAGGRRRAGAARREPARAATGRARARLAAVPGPRRIGTVAYPTVPPLQRQRAVHERARAHRRDRRGRRDAPQQARLAPAVVAVRAGLGLFWLGDVYTYSYPKLVGDEVPFPSRATRCTSPSTRR